MKIVRQSIIDNDWYEWDLPVTSQALIDYTHGGVLLQRAFPDLDIFQRDFIMNGITPKQWKEMDGKSDDSYKDLYNHYIDNPDNGPKPINIDLY